MVEISNTVLVLAPVKPESVVLDSIRENAKRAFGLKNCELEFVEDKSLLGGFKLAFGSRSLDLSIAGRINQIQKKLESGNE